MNREIRVAPPIRVAHEVRAALAAHRPLVALESTLITHGFARPTNLDAALAAEAAVRSRDAVPATIAVHNGELIIGLTTDELAELAQADGAQKASTWTLAAAIRSGGWAGTTVSATMIGAHLAGIRVFATGGIGGVHRGGEQTFDVSADLEELARTPVVVVCAGPKSLLDIDLTLEYLETRGVPVVGWQAHQLAGFYSRDSGRTLSVAVDNGDEMARLALTHWSLGLQTGLLLAVPVPAEAALPRQDADRAISTAIADAEAVGIHGPQATPFVLARVAELTSGRSVAANLALIENNASVAADIATSLLRLGPSSAVRDATDG